MPPGIVEKLEPVAEEAQAGTRAKLSLVLVDDHAILRQGLRALLELEPDIAVVGEAACCDEALKLIPSLRPDVVLTDIGMPGQSGLSMLRQLRRQCPDTRIILLTAHASEEYIHAALDARTDGYVLKDSGHAELIAAIRTVSRGERYMCQAVTDTVMASYLARGNRGARQNPLQTITEREKQVLIHVASGETNKSAARALNLSVKTVEKHRANMMRKLMLHNAADVTRFALKHRLIDRAGGDAPAGEHPIWSAAVW